MLNEKEMQERINRRLASLSASPQRRARIRTAMDAERKEAGNMKRKLSAVWVIALTAVLLTAALAIAETLNLFDFFGERDERYRQVAQEAQLESPLPVTVEWDTWEDAHGVIDSAYFDGLSLSLAFRVEQGQHAETWTPDEKQLGMMTRIEKMPVLLESGHPDMEVYRGFNEALEKGTPYGYRAFTVYPSDHAYAQDGTDIPPSHYVSRYMEDGTFAEMREFEVPLPDALAKLNEITLSIKLYRAEEWVYFDGKDCYRYDARGESGCLEAVVPKTEGQVIGVSGSGSVCGIRLDAVGKASRMAVCLDIHAEENLEALFESVPDTVDGRDRWLHAVALDEEGRRYLPQEGMDWDMKDAQLLLYGTGELPRELRLYVYPSYEGMEEINLEEMDSILLSVREP